MKRKIRFIVNPISGVGKKNAIPKLVQKYLDHDLFDYDIAYTEFKAHAKTLATQSVEEEIDIICAVGGDGSVNEVGASLINTKACLAIIPAGSGNGLARHLKISTNLKKAIAVINTGRIETIDTGLINDKPFLGIGGFGFDALIAKRFDEYHKRGFLSYAKLVFTEFRKYNPISVTWTSENKTFTDLILCTVANASQFGNGFCVAPKADVQDGKLELFFLKKVKWYSLLPIMYRFFRCKADGSKYTETFSFTETELKLNFLKGHIDGEPVEVKETIHLKCVPKSLNIIVGPKY